MPSAPFHTRTRPHVALMAALARQSTAATEIERAKPLIHRLADATFFDLDAPGPAPPADTDLAIVFGGDGSILRAAHRMGYTQIPVLGINLGKLGFLADILPDQLQDVLADVCAGRCRVVDHLMFECRLFRGDQLRHRQLGLNEVAILAGPPFALLDVQLYVDAELATTYSCDGLIVSTPVGSTAHNLSAGGPILRKDLEAFVISPISPHTLTNRPVVDSADRVYQLVVPRPHVGTALVIDGRLHMTLSAEDRIRVQRSESRFQLLKVTGHGDYRRLRDKLGWGGGLRSNGAGTEEAPAKE